MVQLGMAGKYLHQVTVVSLAPPFSAVQQSRSSTEMRIITILMYLSAQRSTLRRMYIILAFFFSAQSKIPSRKTGISTLPHPSSPPTVFFPAKNLAKHKILAYYSREKKFNLNQSAIPSHSTRKPPLPPPKNAIYNLLPLSHSPSPPSISRTTINFDKEILPPKFYFLLGIHIISL